MPFPDPVAPDAIVIQPSAVDAVHAHPAVVVTLTDPLSPPAAMVAPVGVIEKAHGTGVGVGLGGGAGDGDGSGVGGWGTGAAGGSSACAIVTLVPPIVTAPVRAAPGFAATVTTTEPLRLPLAFAGRVSHAALLAADHEHPVNVSTVIVTAPPFADTAVFAGVTVKRQGAGSCRRRTWILLTSMVARRCAGSGFGITRYDTVPSPCPS